MQKLALEFISLFGLPPVPSAELAADLGCQHLTAVLEPIEYNPQGYPKYSLRDDANLRREMIAAMRDRGVSISLGEGFAIFENIDVRQAYRGDLDVMAELGAPRINVVTFEPDRGRCFDQLATLTELAAAVGIATVVEFVPIFTIPDLPTALAAVRHVGRPDCKLLIDTMHVGRSGATAADLAAVDPALIDYVQFCDVPLVATNPDYMDEAMYERIMPGEGELPLVDMLAALPHDRVIGLEVPMRSLADAGIGPEERMKRCVDAARALFAEREPGDRQAAST
jgi:sugar phosphate isomerase/epimerase